ncbi:DUF4175 family protein [Pseudenhygromyxa sp. WMMC2535]|uniref:DUF4175 family protein n=1 Tax=Pseudenhygromyxa sp. WMMC2535 TaxID=2712867 RepID=UPI0015570051|nr:DUF4175 family protein [Pseudenhygromyxa sp. WMMC2535]NVB42130.1 DUF4175 family protein [Pseudenhygromyxa sp. WMMC2535]
MPALPPAQLLRDYLDAVRGAARRRAIATLFLEILTLWAVLCAALQLAVGLSLRGDLGATWGLAVVTLSPAIWAVLRGRPIVRRLRSHQSVAQGIAATPGPLHDQAHATPRERERDVTLRQEILGATELWLDTQAQRSPELADAYVRRIGAATLAMDPRLGLPRPHLGARVLAIAIALAGLAGATFLEPGASGLTLLTAGEDGRPPTPPRPVWTELELELHYPAHTRRPDRVVPNPSGALRVPAGTEISLDMRVVEAAAGVSLILVHDPVGPVARADAPGPEVIPLAHAADTRWTGSFNVRGAASWVVVLLDEDGQNLDTALRRGLRSEPMRIELEPDMPPEVELLPLPESRREASETDRVELRFSARDDFGVVGAELVYELGPPGEEERFRLPAGDLEARGGSARSWRHRYDWDLSTIPLAARAEVTYWIEVRDNDPGLGLLPLPDGPGKVTASARQRLLVHDEEAEHAENIADLQAIRDAAVDLLAARLTTESFDGIQEAASDRPLLLRRKLADATDLHEGAGALLTMLADAVDALAVDTMVAERDVATLAGVHERLLELHRRELAIYEDLPPGSELADLDGVPQVLTKLAKHNPREVSQLEDEIIRLDDLVDGQIIDRLEALVARLQVSQQKLVELLEQLAAGDESVRPAVEQLEQRIREDMRRVQEARAQLRKEVGEEWMNLDALRAMEARMQSQALLEQLRRGDVEGALEQAREGLDAIRRMREQVQDSGAEAEAPALSEEDQKRMKMLRELSRLQDEQTGLRGETRQLHERWREAVGDRAASDESAQRARQEAQSLRERLEAINDAHLSREGREAWEDARAALQALEAASAGQRPGEQGERGERSEDDDPGASGRASALDMFEAAAAAAEALERAREGAKADEDEGRALRQLSREAQRLGQSLRQGLPDPDEVLTPEDVARLTELGDRQQSLRQRGEHLLDDPAADILPEPGVQAMRGADQAMGEASESLDDAALEGALQGEQRAWQSIQRAIDSLRRSSPPPPPAGSGGESSTEAERDRSLRDQVVEAMREGKRDDFSDDTKRYYEELLR